MGYLLNISLAGKSGVCSAGKEEYGSRGSLGQEILGGCFNCSGVMVLGY